MKKNKPLYRIEWFHPRNKEWHYYEWSGSLFKSKKKAYRSVMKRLFNPLTIARKFRVIEHTEDRFTKVILEVYQPNYED